MKFTDPTLGIEVECSAEEYLALRNRAVNTNGSSPTPEPEIVPPAPTVDTEPENTEPEPASERPYRGPASANLSTKRKKRVYAKPPAGYPHADKDANRKYTSPISRKPNWRLNAIEQDVYDMLKDYDSLSDQTILMYLSIEIPQLKHICKQISKIHTSGRVIYENGRLQMAAPSARRTALAVRGMAGPLDEWEAIAE